MTFNAVETALPPFIQKYLHQHVLPPLWPAISASASFEELQLDALAPVEFALLLEEECGCPEIPESTYRQWRRVADVIHAYEALSA